MERRSSPPSTANQPRDYRNDRSPRREPGVAPSQSNRSTSPTTNNRVETGNRQPNGPVSQPTTTPRNREPNRREGDRSDFNRDRRENDRDSRNRNETPRTPGTNPAPGSNTPRWPFVPGGSPGNQQGSRPDNRNNDDERQERDGRDRDRSRNDSPSWGRPPGSNTFNRPQWPQADSRRFHRRWRRPVSNRPNTPRHRRPNHKRPPVRVYVPVPVYNHWPSTSYYYSYNANSSLWPYDAYTSNDYYAAQDYYRYREDRQYQDNELGSFQGEVVYYGDDDWFEYRANNKTWQVMLLHGDTIHPEEGDRVQVIGYVVGDVIYAEHVRILSSQYEYRYNDEDER